MNKRQDNNINFQLLTYVSLLLRCSQNFSQKEERCLILSTLVLNVRGSLSLEASSSSSPASSSGAVRSEGADIPDNRDGDEEIASPAPQRPPKEKPLNIPSDSASARMVCLELQSETKCTSYWSVNQSAVQVY